MQPHYATSQRTPSPGSTPNGSTPTHSRANRLPLRQAATNGRACAHRIPVRNRTPKAPDCQRPAPNAPPTLRQLEAHARRSSIRGGYWRLYETAGKMGAGLRQKETFIGDQNLTTFVRTLPTASTGTGWLLPKIDTPKHITYLTCPLLYLVACARDKNKIWISKT